MQPIHTTCNYRITRGWLLHQYLLCQAPFLTEQSSFFCPVPESLLFAFPAGQRNSSAEFPNSETFKHDSGILVMLAGVVFSKEFSSARTDTLLICAKMSARCHYGGGHPTGQKQGKIFVFETYLLQVCISMCEFMFAFVTIFFFFCGVLSCKSATSWACGQTQCGYFVSSTTSYWNILSLTADAERPVGLV